MSLTEESTDGETGVRLRAAIFSLYVAAMKERGELGDLKPTFWVSLGRLKQAAGSDSPPDLLVGLVAECRRELGAPGDFGYGTPVGDGLRVLYAEATVAQADG